MNQLFNYLSNRNVYASKKYLYEIIQERYTEKHDKLMERICHNLITEDDLTDFGKLLVDVYESGYFRAVEDHKDALENMGLKATVKKQDNVNHPKIFQSEKSG